jgi:GT2 family glycosyltransferase
LVSVVVVNYNGTAAIERCLTALLEDPGEIETEILVVDNASSDGSDATVERLAGDHDSLRLIRSDTNRGYAGAVNLALRAVGGEFVAVLNMDVVVSDGWLEPLVAYLEANSDVGAACPLIVLESDQSRINAAGQNIHPTALGFNRWLEQPRGRTGTQPFRVSGLHGAAFVVGRELLERLGGWDDSGFLYHEDVELSWLLRLAGKDIFCVPASTVSHDYHLTMFPEKLFLLERNRWKMLLANLRGRTRLALAPLLMISELMMWAYCLLRGPSFLRAKWRSYGWLRANAEVIRHRSREVAPLRRASDWAVLRRMHWGYPLGQFVTLGRERGESERNRIET